MRYKCTDILILLILLSLPLFGVLQACGGGGPTAPGTPDDTPPPDNHAPVAVVSVVSPEEGPTPFAVKLDASESFDPDGDEIEFSWIFSDGTSGFGPIIEHEFTRSGKNEVRLIVTDKWGLADDEGPITFHGWGLASSPWPKYAHDERNSGVSPNAGPMMDLENADDGGAFPRYWRGGINNADVNAVCIGYDGRVIYTQGSWLRARTPEGAVIWDIEAESDITAWPAIAYDGTIIVGTEAGCVHKIGLDSEVIWSTNLSGILETSIILDSAVNIDGNRVIYVGGYSKDYEQYYEENECDYYYISKAYILALSFDGDLIWSNETTQTWGYHYSDRPPLIPALTSDGNIIINGDRGYMVSPDGILLTTFEFYYWFNEKTQRLGPPSISEDGLIAFTHGRLPLFYPDGTFFMQMTGELVGGGTDGYSYAGSSQAPVWGSDYILQTQYSGIGITGPSLVQRSLGGYLQQIHLKNSRGWSSGAHYAGATQDSLDRIYVSCHGLHAFTPVSISSIFPHVPRRYSMWHYERTDKHMTAPAIGEDGWMYFGCGPDIMAIGD